MGSAPSKTFNPVEEFSNLNGKVILVTGSSSGIGFAIVHLLSRMGAKVYMAARNADRAQAAIERMNKAGREPGNGEVIFHQLDLTDPRSAQASAKRFLEIEQRLDVLINNAAVIPGLKASTTLNDDGIVDIMAVNYLGPYVFTQTLLPLLESTAASGGDVDVRIVNVGSDAHKFVKSPDYSTKEAWNNTFRWTILPSMSQYGYSKLAEHLWTNHLVKQFTEKDSKILVLTVHPGSILSDGSLRVLSTLPYPPFWIWLAGKLMYPQEQGAFTPVFAACAPRENPYIFPGAYICPPNVAVPQAKAALNEQTQQQLEDATEAYLRTIELS